MNRLFKIMTMLSVVPFAAPAMAQSVTLADATVHPQNIQGDTPFLIAIEAFYPETCGAVVRGEVTESMIEIELDVTALETLENSPCANATDPKVTLVDPRALTDEPITFTSPLTISFFTRVGTEEAGAGDIGPASEGTAQPDYKPLYTGGGVAGRSFVTSRTIEFSTDNNRTKPLQAGSWASTGVNGQNVTIDQQGDRVILILAQNSETGGSAHEFAVGQLNGNVFMGDLRVLDCTPGPNCNIGQSHRIGDVNMLVDGYNYVAMNVQRDDADPNVSRQFTTEQYSRLKISSDANYTVMPFKESLTMPDLNGTWALHFPDNEEMMVFTLEGSPDSSAYTVTSRSVATDGLNNVVSEQTSFIDCISDKADSKYGFCIHDDIAADLNCSFDFAIADAGSDRIDNVAMCRDVNGQTQVGTMVRIKN